MVSPAWRLALALLCCVAPFRVAGSEPPPSLDPSRIESWALPDADLYAVTTLGDRVWAVGYWGTVLWSTDGGETFHRGETPTRETLYDVAFATPERGWAVGGRGTLLSTRDGGATWTLQRVRFEDDFGDEVELDTALFGVAAASASEAWAVGDLGIVLHTSDGEGWERVRVPEAAFADENLIERIFNAVVFTDPRTGWIAGEFGTVLRTRDGGATWEGARELRDAPVEPYLFQLTVTEQERSASSDSAPASGPARGAASDGAPAPGEAEPATGEGPGVPMRAVAVGLAGTVLVSSDGGRVWDSRRVPTSAALYAIDGRGEAAVAAGDRGVVYATSDGGATWVEAERPRLFGWLSGVAYGEGARVFAVGANGVILRSDDGGRRFERISSGAPRGVPAGGGAAQALPGAPSVGTGPGE